MSAFACSGPAPPNATSTKSPGSRPRSTETKRTACAMLASAIAMIAAAASTTAMSLGLATCASMAAWARAASILSAPPSRYAD